MIRPTSPRHVVGCFGFPVCSGQRRYFLHSKQARYCGWRQGRVQVNGCGPVPPCSFPSHSSISSYQFRVCRGERTKLGDFRLMSRCELLPSEFSSVIPCAAEPRGISSCFRGVYNLRSNNFNGPLVWLALRGNILIGLATTPAWFSPGCWRGARRGVRVGYPVAVLPSWNSLVIMGSFGSVFTCVSVRIAKPGYREPAWASHAHGKWTDQL